MASEIRVNTINNRSGLGTISISDSGASLFGNIGIGTDNPLSTLHLSNAGAEGLEIVIANGANINAIQHYNRSGSVYVTHRNIALDHRFETSGIEKLRITSAGNVGIGVTNPDLKLHVNGVNALPSTSGSTPTGHLTLRNKAGNSSHGMFMGVSNAAPWSSWIQAQDANNNATEYPLLLNPNGGNIGIGTTSPQAISGYTVLTLNNATQGGAIEFQNNGTSYGRLLQGSNAVVLATKQNIPLIFNTNDTERLRIDSSGRVGVGTASPDQDLTIGDGSNNIIVNLKSGTSQYCLLDFGDSAGIAQGRIAYYNNDDAMAFRTNGSGEDMRIDSSGRLLIGAPSAPLDDANAPLQLVRSATGPKLIFARNDTSVAAGEEIGVLRFYGNDADGTYQNCAQISVQADLDHGTGDKPTRIVFATTADGASSPTERMTIDSGGRLLVGITTARTNFFNTPVNSAALQVEGTNTTNRTVAVVASNISSISGARLVLAHQKSGTLGGNTALASGDHIGAVNFQGSNGSLFVDAASITAVVDGPVGINSMPGRLVFSTTADDASSPTERLRIDNEGILFSTPTYDDTTTNAANVFVSSTGRLSRSTSSLKYKTDVETLQDSYADAVLDCRPVWYRSTTGNDNPEWGWWGFIAEEVAEIDPRLVFWKTTKTSHDENGSVVETPLETPEPEGVQYDRFVPHLLNLIKRQQQAIETLEAEVAALKAQ